MPKVCGELKAVATPSGGVGPDSLVRYTDGTERFERGRWSRMRFDIVSVGDVTLRRALVANDMVGHGLAQVPIGTRVCLFYFGHLLRGKVIIGIRREGGGGTTMGTRGILSGLLWYGVFSPLIVGIAAGFVGMLVGAVFSRKGTAMGLLLGVLYAVGISWYSGFRLLKAYREMQAG